MSKYFLLQDQQKCIGCHSCEIQCKINKSLPPETRPCQVIQVGPEFFNDKPRASFIFMPCFHCENPWCVLHALPAPCSAVKKTVLFSWTTIFVWGVKRVSLHVPGEPRNGTRKWEKLSSATTAWIGSTRV